MEMVDLVYGAMVIVGIVQWFKGIFKGIPKIILGIMVPLLAVAYAFASPELRFAAGVVSVSQLGYETLFQPVKALIDKIAAKP